MPSLQFVVELSGQEYPQQELEDYIAAHAAYWILQGCGVWTDWVSLMEAVPYFALAVARQITKRNSNKYRGSKAHPTDDPYFDKDTLFPAQGVEVASKEEHVESSSDDTASQGAQIAAQRTNKRGRAR